MKQKLSAFLTILALTLSIFTLFSFHGSADTVAKLWDDSVLTDKAVFNSASPAAQTIHTFSTWNGGVADGFAGGDGSYQNPYRIATADELAYLAKSVASGNSYEGKYIILTNHIQLNAVDILYNEVYGAATVKGEKGNFNLELGVSAEGIVKKRFSYRGAWVEYSQFQEIASYPSLNKWVPIGNETNPFNGNFNGWGHTISGIYCNDRNRDFVGLFGYSVTGTMQNLRIENSFFCGNNHVGSVLGCLVNYEGVALSNCYSSAIVCGTSDIGGIVGTGAASQCTFEGCAVGLEYTAGIAGCANTPIVSCNSNGYVYGVQTTGGIAGISHAEIDSCNAFNLVRGENEVGGIAGHAFYTISNCRNSANVIGETHVGGIVGSFESADHHDNAYVCNCYNRGKIQGLSYVGGICGYGYANRCYNLGIVSGSKTVGGIIGQGYAVACENQGTIDGKTLVGGICGTHTQNSHVFTSYCINKAAVKGESYVGGIVGSGNANYSANMAKISGSHYIGGIAGEGFVYYSHNAGNISGKTYVGGICGRITISVSTCYNVGEIHGDYYVGGIAGYYNDALQDDMNTEESSPPIDNCYYKIYCAVDNDGVFQNALGHPFSGQTTPDTAKQGVASLTEAEMRTLSAYEGFALDAAAWVIDKKTDYPYPKCKGLIYCNHKYEIIYDRLAAEATCHNAATYYYICECGMESFDTFQSGLPLNHDISHTVWCSDMQSHWRCCYRCGTTLQYEDHVWDKESITLKADEELLYLDLLCTVCNSNQVIQPPSYLDSLIPMSSQSPSATTPMKVEGSLYQTIKTIFFFAIGCVVGGFALYAFYIIKETKEKLAQKKAQANKPTKPSHPTRRHQ